MLFVILSSLKPQNGLVVVMEDKVWVEVVNVMHMSCRCLLDSK